MSGLRGKEKETRNYNGINHVKILFQFPRDLIFIQIRQQQHPYHHSSIGPSRVSFPSPCITGRLWIRTICLLIGWYLGTRQLTDQSSTSHPSSPPSPSPGTGARSRIPSDRGSSDSSEDQSLHLLKQYYLDCILRIDPNHPVGQKFARVSGIQYQIHR